MEMNIINFDNQWKIEWNEGLCDTLATYELSSERDKRYIFTKKRKADWANIKWNDKIEVLLDLGAHWRTKRNFRRLLKRPISWIYSIHEFGKWVRIIKLNFTARQMYACNKYCSSNLYLVRNMKLFRVIFCISCTFVTFSLSHVFCCYISDAE